MFLELKDMNETKSLLLMSQGYNIQDTVDSDAASL